MTMCNTGWLNSIGLVWGSYLLWTWPSVTPSMILILQLLGKKCAGKLNDPYRPIDIYSGASTQPWYIVVNFWHVLPAGRLILELMDRSTYCHISYLIAAASATRLAEHVRISSQNITTEWDHGPHQAHHEVIYDLNSNILINDLNHFP